MYKIQIVGCDAEIFAKDSQAIYDFFEFSRFMLSFENLKFINYLVSGYTDKVTIQRVKETIIIEKIGKE